MHLQSGRDIDSWAHYEQIQGFKRDPRAIIDGVNYAHVIALYLYDRSILHWFKILAFCFLFSAKTSVTGRDRDLLNYYSYRYKGRPDYDFIADRLVEIAGDLGDAAETSEVFSPLQSWSTLIRLPRSWRAVAGYQATIRHRVAAAALMAKYWSTACRSFRHLATGRTSIVTFCDAAPHDNLLAQLAKNGGAKTVTAQHGQYRLLDSRNISTDAEAYANFVSDRMLCWGEATCSEFAQYGVARERMVVTGWIRIWDRIGAPPGATGAFGVMLNGENGADSNCDLLQTANRISDELGLKFIVRLHPAFTSPRYASLVNDRCSSIGVIPTSEYVSRVEFSVAHMSGAAIEMLQIGSPVYLLDDGRLADAFKLPGLSFRGQDEVLAAVREDLTSADRGRYRTRRLKRWFNDDTDQERRILNAMLAEVM